MDVKKWCNDQPGRVLACFVFAPVIGFKGIDYRDTFLLFFSVLLFAWDYYWLLFKKPSLSYTS